MICRLDIDKLAKEFDLTVWSYTDTIFLQSKKRYQYGTNNGSPDIYEFRQKNGTWDIWRYISGINEGNSLVYHVIFGMSDNSYEFCRQKFIEFELEYKKYKQELKIKELNGDFTDDDEGTV